MPMKLCVRLVWVCLVLFLALLSCCLLTEPNPSLCQESQLDKVGMVAEDRGCPKEVGVMLPENSDASSLKDSCGPRTEPQYLISFDDKSLVKVPRTKDMDPSLPDMVSPIDLFDFFLSNLPDSDLENKLVQIYHFPIRGVNLSEEMKGYLENNKERFHILEIESNERIYVLDPVSGSEYTDSEPKAK
jgi:hypothetical protein